MLLSSLTSDGRLTETLSLSQVCKSPDRVKKWKEALSSEEFVASQRPQIERVTSGFDTGPDSDLPAPPSDGFDPDLLDPEPLFAPPSPVEAASNTASKPDDKPPIIDLDSTDEEDDDDMPVVIESLSTPRFAPPPPPSRPSALAGRSSEFNSIPAPSSSSRPRPREPLVEGDANGNAEAGPSRQWKKPRVENPFPSAWVPPPPRSSAAPTSSKRESLFAFSFSTSSRSSLFTNFRFLSSSSCLLRCCSKGRISTHVQDSFQDWTRHPSSLDVAGFEEGKGESCSSSLVSSSCSRSPPFRPTY